MNTHKFDVADAEKYGIEKAILLEHLKFHQEANHGNDEMVIDGKVHAFIKPKTIKEMYPYMNYASVRRWLKELEEDGVIESCKPKAKGGYHLKYYHVKGHGFPNDQNDQSNDQNAHSLNDQNDQSSNITNVKSTYVYGEVDEWDTNERISYQSFVEAFNELYDRQLHVTEEKKEMIRARLRTYTGAEIKEAWEARKKSVFLNNGGSQYMGNWAAAMRNDEKIDRYLNLPAEKMLESQSLGDNSIYRS